MKVFHEVELPKSKWHDCRTCKGEGKVLTEGDAHRSPGLIPCPADLCRNGIVKTVRVHKEVPRWTRR